MTNLSNYVEKYGKTGLEHLSDDELLQYASLYDGLTAREISYLEIGHDSKNAVHLVRNLLEGEQLLSKGDMDIQQDREVLKSVRRGEWSLKQIDDFFDLKEKHLEEAYSKSPLPHSPNEAKIKELLLQCIEHHYGTVSQKLYIESTSIISDLKALIEKHGGK
jgi:uncharacterized protein